MLEIIKKIKFEYVFAVLVIFVLSAALFVFKGDKDIVNIIITCLVGAVSSITAFFFTKHNPSRGDK